MFEPTSCGPFRPDLLAGAQDDAAELAIRDMERAGIDVITDGEVRRESYSNHLIAALEGIDAVHPAALTNRAGRSIPVPRVVGPIRRTRAVEVDALSFLRRMTDRPVKVTLPGPFTLTQQAKDEWYQDPEAVAMDFAAAVNEESAGSCRPRALTSSSSTSPGFATIPRRPSATRSG